jgi:hypothetical protein
MIANTALYERTGNLGGRSQAMGIHADAFAHIMDSLANLYEFPKVALLREYATNGRDALIAAGRAHLPVEISLPGGLRNSLEIRDRGIGLDADEIFEIYSMYGASTKRESNEFNGILGFGCKAALSYTAQFSLISVKNGIKTIAVIGLIENGTGETTIVSEAPTDEPDGTLVQIPTKQGDSFESEANVLFQYWEPGTMLVNGRDLSKKSEWLKLDDNTYFEQMGQTYGFNDVVVMGGVPYPVTTGRLFDTSGQTTFRVIAYVPMGAVNFAPSREAMRYTDLTKDAIAGVRAHVKNTLHSQIDAEINAAANQAEAYGIRDKWFQMLGRWYMKREYTAEYHGIPFPDDFDVAPWIEWTRTYQKSSYSIFASSKMDYDNYFSTWERSKRIFVTNCPIDVTGHMPAHLKGRLSKWAKEQGHQRMVLLPDAKVFQSPWLDEANHKVINWHKIQWPVAERAPRGTVKRSYKVPVYNSSDWYAMDTEVDDLPTNTTMLYLPADQARVYGGAVRAFVGENKKVTVVVLRANQIDKFLRHFPKAELIHTYNQRQIDKLYAKAKAHDHKRLGQDTRSFLEMFDEKRITSKPMLAAFEAARTQDDYPPEVMRYNKAVNDLGDLRGRVRFERIGTSTYDIKLREHYPLLDFVYDHRLQNAKRNPAQWAAALDHLYNYINSI